MSDCVPLQQLRPGQSAEVVSISTTNVARLLKLTAYGLTPGAVVTVEQREPAYIVSVGETQLSLDGEVTAEIMTRVLA